MEEIAQVHEMSDTEIVTVAIDRLYRDLCTQDADLTEAVRHFTAKIHALEETPVDQWQWTGADLEQLEWLLNAIAKPS